MEGIGFAILDEDFPGQAEKLRQNPLPVILQGAIDGAVEADGFDQTDRQFPLIFLLGSHFANPFLVTTCKDTCFRQSEPR